MINLGKITKFGKEIILEKQDNGCIKCLSHCQDTDGYTRIRYNGKHERLFRVIYMQKYGEIPKGMLIRHKCDNTWCCNIEHLEIGTQKDNVRDMIERGRDAYHRPNISCRGEKNKQNKLNEKQVKEIYLSNLGYKRLSKIYNVSTTNIRNIKKKFQWKWLTDTLD
jgi:hypothetical protein